MSIGGHSFNEGFGTQWKVKLLYFLAFNFKRSSHIFLWLFFIIFKMCHDFSTTKWQFTEAHDDILQVIIIQKSSAQFSHSFPSHSAAAVEWQMTKSVKKFLIASLLSSLLRIKVIKKYIKTICDMEMDFGS